MDELYCHNLSFSRDCSYRGKRTILDKIEIGFSAGTLNLITGQTGTGKSTFIHIIAGLIRPTSGEFKALGLPVSRWTSSHRDRWRRHTGIVFQHLHLINTLTALENVMLPLLPRGIAINDIRQCASQQLIKLGLQEMAGEWASQLSIGERQRLAVARAIVGGPKFLLADEPTAHQDDKGFALVMDTLCNHKKCGCSIIVTGHDPRLSYYECFDRHLTLKNGNLQQVRGKNASSS